MIRVLDLRDSSWVDGPGRTVLETAPALRSFDIQVVIGGFRNAEGTRNDYLDTARDRGLETLDLVERSALDLAAIRKIQDYINTRQIDIVHTHDFRTNIFGLYCARRASLPVVATCHGWIANDLRARAYRRIDKALLKRFDGVIAVSDDMHNQLVAGGGDRNKIAVVVNALSIDQFVPGDSDTEFRAELEIPESAVVVASIGRLSAEKGHTLLFQAVAALHTDYPDLVVVIVGMGSEEQSLRQLTETLEISNVVKFVGHRNDMTRIYNSIDLVVQSSLTEGMPNVILESLLMQKPVIATDVGGTAEIVEHKRTGYLVSPGSSTSLVQALRDFFEHRDSHRLFALNGRSHVAKNFNHRDRVERMAEIYATLVGEHK